MPSPNTTIRELKKELEREQAFSDWQASYIRKFAKRYGFLDRKHENPLSPVQRFIARLFGICEPPVKVKYDRKKGMQLWKAAS